MNAGLPPIDIAIADDHALFRSGLAAILEDSEHFRVVIEASNGRELIYKLMKAGTFQGICILDINMPGMNGYEAMDMIREKWPELKVLAITMYDNDFAIIRMLRKGVNGYICKSSEPKEIKKALQLIYKTGYYHPGSMNDKLHYFMDHPRHDTRSAEISEKEIEFLKYCCTAMTYKEIAKKMHHSSRTIEGYRDALFQKLNIHSRPELVFFALKSGMVTD